MKSNQNICNKANNEMKNSNFENCSFNKKAEAVIYKINNENKCEEYDKLFKEKRKLIYKIQ